MLEVDAGSFLAIVAVSMTAAALAGALSPRVALPVVVVELVLGIVIGPQVLDLAQPDPFIEFFSSLGLGMLFFFAGFEIDFARIHGRPLRLAGIGWFISLALAYALGGLLAVTGVVISGIFVGTAMATTAIGTLVPILTDAGELRTRFGSYLLAAGATAEFLPIVLTTVLFSTKGELSNALLLLAFVVLAVIAAVIAVRGSARGTDLFERGLETSGQLPVRAAVLAVFGLGALAAELGLELLLGGFVAGVITRLALKGQEVPVFESKLKAVAYGFFIPFFFVVSGVKFNLDALLGSTRGLLLLPIFLTLFLVVRGAPVMLLYRDLDLRDRYSLSLFAATQLPLVVAITTLAAEEGHMRTSTAAALVGAAILSTTIFPLAALRLRGRGPDSVSLARS
ncbi:MAG TPA: cation:proton antiporter [Thermoleophilaceae bacterium]|nr:cation:proton antiporter [Thermoleophilaceae bacterium]